MKLKGVLVSHFFANHTVINSQYLGSSWYRRLVTWASHYPSYSHLFSCSSTISGSLQFCYWSSIVTEPFFCLFAYKSSYTDSLREFIIKLRAAAPSSLYDSGEICQFFTLAVVKFVNVAKGCWKELSRKLWPLKELDHYLTMQCPLIICANFSFYQTYESAMSKVFNLPLQFSSLKK